MTDCDFDDSDSEDSDDSNDPYITRISTSWSGKDEISMSPTFSEGFLMKQFGNG